MDDFTKGEIPEYQVSAWAMAVFLNGMTALETTDLTLARLILVKSLTFQTSWIM